ncbi:FlgB family protein [Roseinatronobacter sp.]|uniref:FlgB family protein n=1 Tax=Roseinatronobacter sp. TaxID=1945755 RepID=UPI0025D209A2|nr:FlgB family protein [Rhodobaca sp.]
MFDIPEVMRTAQGMARHAAARQVVIAENIAHADTPGYRARDLSEFSATYAGSGKMVATRPGHLGAAPQHQTGQVVADGDAPARSPNGNTVSLEREMMRAAQNRQSHDLALAVYSSARGILRAALER